MVNYGFLKMRQLLPPSIINVNVTSSQTFEGADASVGLMHVLQSRQIMIMFSVLTCSNLN